MASGLPDNFPLPRVAGLRIPQATVTVTPPVPALGTLRTAAEWLVSAMPRVRERLPRAPGRTPRLRRRAS